jgi:hypothetical protein
VKLIKARNTERKKHEDSHFASAAICFLKDLAVMMGERPVCFLSQDDKARVPLGLPAANKQMPLLMHLEYKVTLPDHDFVIASRHKLIPSVYAACVIKDGCVGYSGPTYIAIRSGKHDSSTAETHGFDFKTLTGLKEFKEFIINEDNVKPIIIITVDGGPDENPRYPKVLSQAISHFKNYDLDAIFIATHAPGQSAYNAVERRMAPLSRDLTGLILPHGHYGSHLDSNGITINKDLELINFGKAGKSLSEIWSESIIDDYPVIAKYIEPMTGQNKVNQTISENWKFSHVRQSQYLLQIVKCDDHNCCKEFRSSIKDILPERFIPPPVLYVRSEKGVQSSEDMTGHFYSLSWRLSLKCLIEHPYHVLPFDYYCPTIRENIEERMCEFCGLYCSSKNSVKSHEKLHKNLPQIHNYSVSVETGPEIVEEMYIDNNVEINNNEFYDSNDKITIINDMNDWLSPCFQTDFH